MIIRNKQGVVILDAPVADESVRYRSIMGENSVTLKYSLAEHVPLPIGSYIEFQGERYTLWLPENFKKHGTRNFEYTVLFGSQQEILKKFKYKNTSSKPYELKFTLTAKPKLFLDLLVSNLNLHDSGWTVGDHIESTEKVLSFNHESCYTILNKLSQEFNTEWEVIGKTIHLRKVERFKTEPLALSYGRGNGFKVGVGRQNDGDKQPLTLLYVQGGERNIDYSTYKSKTLLLPKSQELEYEGRRYKTDADGMYITRAEDPTDIVEDSFDGSSIYPMREGTINNVDVIVKDEGKEDEFTVYDIVDDSIPEALNYADYRIAGEKATIIFQTGMLAGREFDIEQTDKALTGYVHAERKFKLVSQSSDGMSFPNSVFIPKIGDKYAVFGIMLPDSYLSDNTTKTGASWDMFRDAVRYFYENEVERFSFMGELDSVWSRKNWLAIGGKLVPGGYVQFSDAQFQLEGVLIRIMGIRDYINKPHSPELELSNAPVASSVSDELGKIEENEEVVDNSMKELRQYTQRRFRDAKETQKMLEAALFNFSEGINPVWIQTMSLLVGDESLQFRFVNSKTTPQAVTHAFNYNQVTKVFTTPAGIIQHMTLGVKNISSEHKASEYKFWSMSAYTSPPLSGMPALYLYAKCSKSGTTGTFKFSETPHQLEEGSFYYFLVGTIGTESEGERSFTTLYGFTEILPGRITTDKIISADGLNFLDLVAGAARFGSATNSLSYNLNGDKTLRLKGCMVQSPSGDTESLPVWRGTYNSSTTYYKGDEVTYYYNGMTSSYRYIRESSSSGVSPTNVSYWKVVAQGAKGGDGNDGHDGIDGTDGTDGNDGNNGNDGPALSYRGRFSSSTRYFNNLYTRDVVLYGSSYYVYKGVNNSSGGWSSSKWYSFGSSWSSIATGLLFAVEAVVENLIVRQLRTSNNSARVNSNGSGYFANGDFTFDADGNVNLTGKFQSAESGRRIVINPSTDGNLLSGYYNNIPVFKFAIEPLSGGDVFGSLTIGRSDQGLRVELSTGGIRFRGTSYDLFYATSHNGKLSMGGAFPTYAEAGNGTVYKDASGYLKVK